MTKFKIGSLFDGSGGFPLAASLCGIEPTWASEVEPYPIAVTRSRFPGMKHLGSVTDINGGEIEPVDIITFGSPCQDLSVAGKRAGLKHEANGDEETTRSGLFMEAVRIIKEMREATNGRYPTFALWENVPGAFSSNKGEDFRTVCEELIKIVEPGAVMPAVPKNGWPYADCYCGDGWSLAYRVFDAQFWGVPQRRRRIHLILDLRGERAGKVLFEREGVRGNLAESGTPWQATAGDAESGIGADDREGVGLDIYNLAVTGDVATTLTTATGQGASNTGPSVAVPLSRVASALRAGGFKELNSEKARSDGFGYEVSPTLSSNKHDACCVYSIENHPADSRVSIDESGKVQTLTSRMGTGGGNVPMVMEKKLVYCLQGIDRADTAGCNGKGWNEETCYTLNTIDRPAVAYAMQGFGDYKDCGVASGLKARDFKDATDLVVEATVVDGSDAVAYSMKSIARNGVPLVEQVNPICASDYKDPDIVAYPTAYGVDCRNLTEQEELYPTLQAKPNGGQSLNYSGAVRIQYIVCRLTPTEYARLQGFPDNHGHPDSKENFTDEEYKFWLDVRNTHAAINGKAVKEYTKEQMLKWYNRLHTDSAEYKMWGNGIALPPALYCMQGMEEALEAIG